MATSAVENKKNLKIATANLNKLLQAHHMGARKAVVTTAAAIVTAVKLKVGGTGSGRIYVRRDPLGGRRVVQASAPGEPPAKDRGVYQSSFGFVPGEDPDGPYALVGTWDPRGAWFEYGTRRMAPRPHFRPVILAITTEFRKKAVDDIVNAQRSTLKTLVRPE